MKFQRGYTLAIPASLAFTTEVIDCLQLQFNAPTLNSIHSARAAPISSVRKDVRHFAVDFADRNGRWGWARTSDLNIIGVVLFQLSYPSRDISLV